MARRRSRKLQAMGPVVLAICNPYTPDLSRGLASAGTADSLLTGLSSQEDVPIPASCRSDCEESGTGDCHHPWKACDSIVKRI